MRSENPRNLLLGMIVVSLIPSVNADTVGFVKSPLVDHPVSHPAAIRSAARWNSSVGSWGENFAEQTLRMRGFNEIHEIKTGGNQGIDRVAVKRGADGAIKEIKYVEVKATRTYKPRLNRTKSNGQQMSRKHLAENLRKMRNSGDPSLRKLTLEMSRFRRSSGVPLQQMAEVFHPSPKTGRVTTYSGDLRTVKSVESGKELLNEIKLFGSSKEGRRWAARTLADWDQILAQTRTTYLGKNVAQQSRSVILASATQSTATVEAVALRQSRSVLTKKILMRAAGPIAVVVSLGFDATEAFNTEYAYRTGAISERQRNVHHMTKLAGTTGALALAPAGAAAGAWVGAFGGPIAWITVPVGGFVGGTIFGIAGYFGGSAIAEYGAAAWYGSIDASVRERFEQYWLATATPFD